MVGVQGAARALMTHRHHCSRGRCIPVPLPVAHGQQRAERRALRTQVAEQPVSVAASAGPQ